MTDIVLARFAVASLRFCSVIRVEVLTGRKKTAFADRIVTETSEQMMLLAALIGWSVGKSCF